MQKIKGVWGGGNMYTLVNLLSDFLLWIVTRLLKFSPFSISTHPCQSHKSERATWAAGAGWDGGVPGGGSPGVSRAAERTARRLAPLSLPYRLCSWRNWALVPSNRSSKDHLKHLKNRIYITSHYYSPIFTIDYFKAWS